MTTTSPEAPQEEIGAVASSDVLDGGDALLSPTVITGDPAKMLGALKNLAAARESLPEGPTMEAFHVEGPHISPEDGPRGAHPRRWVRPPDLEEYKRWQEAANGNVRLITLSPEWPEAAHYIEMTTRDGVVISIGHTKATAEQIQDAVSAGATLSTHIGNGAHAVMQWHPNYIWEQLAEDRLNASMIVDGIHLGNAFLKVALRAKGIERSVLITDAVMPAMCKPGRYMLGEVEVELHEDESVRMLGGTRPGRIEPADGPRRRESDEARGPDAGGGGHNGDNERGTSGSGGRKDQGASARVAGGCSEVSVRGPG